MWTINVKKRLAVYAVKDNEPIDAKFTPDDYGWTGEEIRGSVADVIPVHEAARFMRESGDAFAAALEKEKAFKK